MLIQSLWEDEVDWYFFIVDSVVPHELLESLLLLHFDLLLEVVAAVEVAGILHEHSLLRLNLADGFVAWSPLKLPPGLDSGPLLAGLSRQVAQRVLHSGGVDLQVAWLLVLLDGRQTLWLLFLHLCGLLPQLYFNKFC